MTLERSELRIILILAAVQFFHTMDFVIMMPLAPLFMEVFGIGANDFGILVSSYTFSSAFFGLLGAVVVDRFDRKKVLMTTYLGFTAGTFLCGIAPSAEFLLMARIVAGAFSGVMVSTIFSIIGDLIPDSRRGTALGILMTSFPLASVFGVPLGIYVANRFGWHSPFIFLASVGLPVFIAMSIFVPSVRQHLLTPSSEAPLSRILYFFQTRHYWPALLFVLLLTFGAFSVIPFISAFYVSNVGVRFEDLFVIYLAGGSTTFFTSQIIGRLSDQFGKLLVFRIVAILSLIPIFILTNLSAVSFGYAVLIFILFMSLVSGRFVPGMALVIGAVEQKRRGAYMSMTTAVQHFGSGCAAYYAARVIETNSQGQLLNFSSLGYVAIFFTLVCAVLASKIPSSL